jgi:hypothetical protein
MICHEETGVPAIEMHIDNNAVAENRGESHGFPLVTAWQHVRFVDLYISICPCFQNDKAHPNHADTDEGTGK